MKRYRTRTTAWPAVADLMTALAVFGLACTFFVVSQKKTEIDDLKAVIEISKAEIDSLKAVIDTLNTKIDNVPTLLPCWPRNDLPGYYITYDIKVQDGRFILTLHKDWALGTEFRDTIPSSLVDVLEDFPKGDVSKEQVVIFLDLVFRVVDKEGHPSDCKLVVTINHEATGREVVFLSGLGLFPVYR